ncbi:hypothetical protein YC2023_101738 [Brassica napus]
MSRVQKVSYLSQVKVLHTWKQTNAGYGETLEIMFADKKGDKIQATCKRAYLVSLGSKCVVGEWKKISNFSVTDAKGHYRTTKHSKKITFINLTKISDCNYHNKDMFLSLMYFEKVLSGNENTSFLIDVIGQALDVGELQTIQCQNEKILKKIEFTLRDMSDMRLQCCITGKLAEILTREGKQPDIGDVCLIRFAKIGSYNGELCVSSNAFNSTLLLINPDIKEAQALKQMRVPLIIKL